MTSSRFVRTSKYRHVFGTCYKKDQCYDNLKVSKSDIGNLVKVNGKYIGLPWESSGGGAFAVIPLNQVGKLPVNYSGIISDGHTGAVLDVDFSPFHPDLIASASEDAKIMIWNLSASEFIGCENGPSLVLTGHGRKIANILFHPTAENVLASISWDLSLKLWDIEKSLDTITMRQIHSDTIHSFAWNYNGSLIATVSKDKKIKVLDPRQNIASHELDGHAGIKGSYVTWLGNSNQLLTTGFSRSSERQVSIWDLAKPSKDAIRTENIDSSSGTLVPYYDLDTKMLYLAGKGDGNIRYYEIGNEEPYIHILSEYKSNESQRGVAFMPKRYLNVSENETARAYKVTNTFVEPISFKVPRKSDVFQHDIFPDTIGPEPAMTAGAFFQGENRDPTLISLEKGFISAFEKKEFKSSSRSVTFYKSSDSVPEKVNVDKLAFSEGAVAKPNLSRDPVFEDLKQTVVRLSKENTELKVTLTIHENRIKELEKQLSVFSK